MPCRRVGRKFKFNFLLLSVDRAEEEVVPPTEVNSQHQYRRYDNFPVPKLENVYKAWKPVDYGNPLKDETLFYRPPSKERVHFIQPSGPQSRSIDDQLFEDFICVQTVG